MKTLHNILQCIEHGEYEQLDKNMTIIIRQLTSTTGFPKMKSANLDTTTFISSGTLERMLKSDRVSQYFEYPVIMVDAYMNNIYLYIDGSTMYAEDPKYSWETV